MRVQPTSFWVPREGFQDSEYEDACPIATVALEVSSTSDTMREACADVFESWIAAGLPRFTAAGLDEPVARELVIAMLCALEGAFVLARATRSTEALKVAGELTVAATQRALHSGANAAENGPDLPRSDQSFSG